MDYKDYEVGALESNFWFKAKKDLIERLFKKLNAKKMKILNLGAGTGDDLKILNKFGNVYVIDVNEKAIELIAKDLYFEKNIQDARNLKYPDNFFDVVASFDVFEHIKEDYRVINEVYRVLKKGGYLIFSVPANQFMYSSHDKALGHKRRYNKNQLKNLLKNFNNLKLYSWNFFLFIPLLIMRISKKNSAPKVDNFSLPIWIDNAFFRLLKIENFLIEKGFSLPLGTSIFGKCKK